MCNLVLHNIFFRNHKRSFKLIDKWCFIDKEINALLTFFCLRKLGLEFRNKSISILISNSILINYWKLTAHITEWFVHSGLTSGKVENKLSKLWHVFMFITQERMLFIKINVHIFLWASEHNDNVFTFVILVFPSVHVVEYHVRWKREPLHLVGILTHSFHDTILRWFWTVELNYKFVLFNC